MRPPTPRQWWLVALAVLLSALFWPPDNGKSLGMKGLNWAVDPRGTLPILSGPLALGLGDDPDAVSAHDLQEQRYYALYESGAWMRRRLELKVASDPLAPSTQRQVLSLLVVVALLLAWRFPRRNG